MSHTTAASFLVWAVLAFLLNSFLIFHLWSFDRFKSIRWNSGSGAFKRVMIYSYMLTIPIIFSYVLGMAIIKYNEGFIDFPPLGIIPKPYPLWGNTARRAFFPLMLMFSLGWALEMVTHLEELCFWLFLVNASSTERSWFHSTYFRIWIVGSTVALLYMPLLTIFTRSDPLMNEACTFLGGSLGSLLLTIWFLPVLWIFPNFLNHLKSEGVDTQTIVRLTKFSELNTIRIVFRFLFTVPLAILGIDGVRPHKHINESMFATDLLIMISGFGCVVSSAITLVIFFPRSIEGEIAERDAAKELRRLRRASVTSFTSTESHVRRNVPSVAGSYLLTSSPIKRDLSLSSGVPEGERHLSYLGSQDCADEPQDIPDTLPPLLPNRKKGPDVELGSRRLTENNLYEHNLGVNPMVSNFTSPIDIPSYVSAGNRARLTFTRR